VAIQPKEQNLEENMMKVRYALEAGQYVCYLDDKRMFDTPDVAVLTGGAPPLVLTHGKPEKVEKHTKNLQQFYAQTTLFSGASNTAPQLCITQGRFDLAGLNRVIEASLLGVPFDASNLIQLTEQQHRVYSSKNLPKKGQGI
jgi:hypothetical protein